MHYRCVFLAEHEVYCCFYIVIMKPSIYKFNCRSVNRTEYYIEQTAPQLHFISLRFPSDPRAVRAHARRPGDEAYIETCNVNVCTPGQSTPSVVNQTVFRNRAYIHEKTTWFKRLLNTTIVFMTVALSVQLIPLSSVPSLICVCFSL